MNTSSDFNKVKAEYWIKETKIWSSRRTDCILLSVLQQLIHYSEKLSCFSGVKDVINKQ